MSENEKRLFFSLMKSIFIYFNKQFAVLKEKGKRGAYEKRRKKAKK